MTAELPERAARAFTAHDAFDADEQGYTLTTVLFDNHVTAAETDDWPLEYTVTVRAPTLSAATSDEVGPAVADGWLDTYKRRLADATMATRIDVALDDYSVTVEDGEAVAEFDFTFGNADRAPDVVKAIVEFVEGTYVEGIVPGYDYEPPVATLLNDASQTGGGGGTPL